MKRTIVVNVNRCLACRSCETACAVEHSEGKDLYEALLETPASKARVEVAVGDEFAAPLHCRQCEDAPCMEICPRDALYRPDPDGPVILNPDLCTGCKWCILACPFGVIGFNVEAKKIVKCDQCFERLQRDELPACIVACPTAALELKSTDDLPEDHESVFAFQKSRAVVETASEKGAEPAAEESKPKNPPVKCPACGSESMTQRQVARLQEKLDLPLELASMCQDCRMTEYIRALERSLISTEDTGCGELVKQVSGRRTGPCDKE